MPHATKKHAKKADFPWALAIACTAAVLLVVFMSLSLQQSGRETEERTTAAKVDSSTRTIVTPDGIKLAATLKLPAKVNAAPAIIFLHEYGRDRHQWDPYLKTFTDAGFVVLSYDMRGFGESRLVKIPASQAEHLGMLSQDLPAVINFVKQQKGVDPKKINIVGASVGAGVAYEALGSNLGLHRGVLLSPVVMGSAFDGHAIPNFSPSNVLAIAASSEQIGVTVYMSKVKDPQQTKLIPNGGHGIALMATAGVVDSMKQWLSQ